MIEINLLPQEDYWARKKREDKALLLKQNLRNSLIAACILIPLLIGGVVIIRHKHQMREQERIEQERFDQARQERQRIVAEQKAAEKAAQREERASMLNELSGKNFTADQWDLLSESERTSLISGK